MIMYTSEDLHKLMFLFIQQEEDICTLEQHILPTVNNGTGQIKVLCPYVYDINVVCVSMYKEITFGLFTLHLKGNKHAKDSPLRPS